ncbi:PLP-dependent aminotransferase family protein [Ureibacillus aquaedulcis]|uniref:PLP-dependent aminotransferase family protein n=1 Tax=Ureibacillus aquaedulcis TaxID=3058421 RepID=A0ABT8GT66_9BACL|nr:PLP-dependent aminotransferase family protein [Ureibacillus sp. BA0131]MDN4494587.1 PLP-dependent aminotransferase family protein [Ureibacillus sp. BA0131]
MKELQPFKMSKRFENVKLISAAAAKTPHDLIPLSFGFPAKEAYDVSLMAKCSSKAIEEGGYKSFEYGGATGPSRIVKWLKKRSEIRGIYAPEENILVTTGSGQAMDILARGLTNEGDEVWVEAPTFFGALRNFTLAGLKCRGFEIDENGLKVDLVEEALVAAKNNGLPMPKFIYIMPNFHNPGGVTLSLERRMKLAKLALAYNFFIIEDDAYTELNFSERVLPAVYQFAPQRVIYMSTFSKTIAPAIRMGWLVAPPEIIMQLRSLKADGSTSVLMQEIVAAYLETIDFDDHVGNISKLYKSRLDAMIKAIDDYLGDEVTYTAPEGGFFLWLTFKEEVATSLFEELALEKGVSFILGEHCYAENEEKNHIRLCFSYCDEEMCKEAIKRIAEAYYEKYPVKKLV